MIKEYENIEEDNISMIPLAIFNTKDLSSTQVHLYTVLLTFCDNELIFPKNTVCLSIELLSKIINRSETTVKRCLRHLLNTLPPKRWEILR